MISLLTHEPTIAERLTAALQARTAAAAAVAEARAEFEAIRPDDDSAKAVARAVEARAAARRTLAQRQEAFDLAADVVGQLERFAFDQHMARRRQQAVELLAKQTDLASEIDAITVRQEALEVERRTLSDRQDRLRVELTQIASKLADLKHEGRKVQQVNFSSPTVTRDAVPERTPMLLSEWQRLWDAATAAGRNGAVVVIDRQTGRLVQALEGFEVPGLPPAA